MEYTTPFVHMIKTPRGHYCYDVNTNQVIRVNEGVYNYLEALEQGKDPGQPEPQVQRKLDQLKGRGLLKTKRPKKMEHPATGQVEYLLDHCLESMTLQVTQQCNFRCDYCPYVQEAFDHQRRHAGKKMTWETAKAAVDFLAEHSTEGKMIAFGFYGGEPLLAFDLIQRVVAYVEETFRGKQILFTTTTNGSLLTDEIMAFLQEHHFDLLLSLDGMPESHNRSRRFAANGKGTFAAIEKNLYRMREKFPQLLQSLSVNAVIDSRFSQRDLYDWFSKHEILKNCIVQATLIDDSYSIMKTISSDEYTVSNSTQMFQGYMASIGRCPWDKVAPMIRRQIGRDLQGFFTGSGTMGELPDVTSHSGPCFAGKSRLLVGVDGDFFPCERVSETSEIMKIGSVQTGFDIPKVKDLLNICKLTEKECKNCWALFHCGICARACDNGGSYCREMKLRRCEKVREFSEDALRDHIFAQENGAKVTYEGSLGKL